MYSSNALFLCCFLFLFIPKGNSGIATDSNSSFMSYVEKRGKVLAPTYSKRNCVQFIDAVLKEYCQIDSKTSERIYINFDLDYLKRLYSKGDTVILSGVCGALIDCRKATWVKVENIMQGDIVQYWSDNGFFNGHCGVYWGKDKEGNILLKGSHLDSNGYGVMNMYNKNQSFRIYCVRLN